MYQYDDGDGTLVRDDREYADACDAITLTAKNNMF